MSKSDVLSSGEFKATGALMKIIDELHHCNGRSVELLKICKDGTHLVRLLARHRGYSRGDVFHLKTEQLAEEKEAKK